MGLTTKQYLNQVQHLDMMITNKLAEIHNLRCLVNGTRGANDEEKVQTSMSGDSFSRMIDRIIDMEHEIDDLVDKRSVIVNQIENLDDITHSKVLVKRYVNGFRFDTIAEQISYSYRQTLREHGEALEEFEQKYGKTYLR